jgi:hypothetical protein
MSGKLNQALSLLRSDGYLKRDEKYEIEAQYQDGHEFHTTLIVDNPNDARKIYADFRVNRSGQLTSTDVQVDRF